jgi:hypothetical protein
MTDSIIQGTPSALPSSLSSAPSSAMKGPATNTPNYPLITFMRFEVGDIALFLRVDISPNHQIWTAFNSNAPYRFLADVSYNLPIIIFLCSDFPLFLYVGIGGKFLSKQ